MKTKFNVKKALAFLVLLVFTIGLIPIWTISPYAEELINSEENTITEEEQETNEEATEENIVDDKEEALAEVDLEQCIKLEQRINQEDKEEHANTTTEDVMINEEDKNNKKDVNNNEVAIERVTLQILGTTDLHGRFTNYEYARDLKSDGGLTQISTLVKEARAANPNTIVIDNGDTIQGNYNHLFTKPGQTNPMILAMNEIGYDVMNLGNHEFNFGMEVLSEVAKQANENLNILCANLYKDGKRVFNPYAIKEVGGVKVAIIGVVSPAIVKWDSQNLAGYESTNPTEEVDKVIDEIVMDGGADVYIVSSHVGQTSEYGNGDSATEIANANPEVSAILMGHSHAKNAGQVVNNALLIQPSNNGSQIAKAELYLEKVEGKWNVVNKGGKLLDIRGVATDENLSTKLTNFDAIAKADARTVIGQLDKDLAKIDEIKGIPESLVGDQGVTDFVNEVQVYNMKKHLKERGIDPDSAYLVSAAALFDADSNLKAGPITKAGISKIYKYDNKLYTIKTTGKQLKKFMEWTASIYNQHNTGDLTVSLNEKIRLYNYDMFDGISYEVNISKPAGSRIENLKFEKDGKVVGDDEVVYLAVNNYRYDSILNAPSKPVFDPGASEKLHDTSNDNISDMRDLIIDYIINVKDGSITRSVDNNWKLTGVNYDGAFRAHVVKAVNNGEMTIPTSEDGRTPNVRSLTCTDVLNLLAEKNLTRIDLMTFNDFHGNVEEVGKNIGAAKLAALIKFKYTLINNNYGAFAVAAGDLYQGTAISNLTYGEPVSEFFKEINLTASALGNHEFDWGINKIEKWQEDGNFQFLAANIVDKTTGNPVTWAEPYKIIESNGIKVGIIGITTEETAYKTKPENVESVKFLSPEEVVNKYAKELKEDKGVNAVVVLSHLGATQDKNTKEINGEAADLAKVAIGVDAIIAGHDHQFTSGIVNDVTIVQAGYNGRALANISFDFDNTGKLVAVTPNLDEAYNRVKDITADVNVKELVAKYKADLDPILNEVVTTLSKDLDYNSREGLQPLGIVVAETMRKITDADICITNGGGIRAPLTAGNITVGSMYTILPFDNTLVTMELTGAEIKAAIEHGIAPSNMGWGQFSGIKVWYDKDAKAGERVTSIRLIDGTPLDMGKYYKVVVNDFMATGGDGYNFSNAKNVYDTNIVMRESIQTYWKENGIDENTPELLIAGKDDTQVKPGDPNPEEPKPEEPKPGKPTPEKPSKPGRLPNTGGVDSLYLLLIGVTIIGAGFFNIRKIDREDIA